MSLKEISTRLGISVTTVSRALGGYADVSEETRARVRAEAERIGYQPNQIARRLRKGRSETIGVVIPSGTGGFSDPYFGELIGAIGTQLSGTDFDLLLATADSGAQEARVFRRLVDGGRIDGMIVVRPRFEDPRIAFLRERHMPFVVVGRMPDGSDDPWIDVEASSLTERTTERLIGFGHRRIADLSMPRHFAASAARLDGYRRAMVAAGLEPDVVDLEELTEQAGFAAADAVLARPSPPTAILAGNDVAAVGVYRAARRYDLVVGRDLAVVGYGDLPVARLADPPLSTIRVPIRDLGRRATELVLQAIDAGLPDGFHEVFRGELVSRASDAVVVG